MPIPAGAAPKETFSPVLSAAPSYQRQKKATPSGFMKWAAGAGGSGRLYARRDRKSSDSADYPKPHNKNQSPETPRAKGGSKRQITSIDDVAPRTCKCPICGQPSVYFDFPERHSNTCEDISRLSISTNDASEQPTAFSFQDSGSNRASTPPKLPGDVDAAAGPPLPTLKCTGCRRWFVSFTEYADHQDKCPLIAYKAYQQQQTEPESPVWELLA